MVTYEVDGNFFGYMDRLGFFTSPVELQVFTRVSPKDMRDIADKMKRNADL